MNQKISVLIVDDNLEFCRILDTFLKRQEDIEVLGISMDGLDALDKIDTLMPDIVILDVVMPSLDGIGVLERLSSKDTGYKPLFIMLSAVGQDVFIQRALSLGAEYYIVKPFDMNVLLLRIRQIYKEKNYISYTANKSVTFEPNPKQALVPREKNVEREVTTLMHEVGIPPHLIGYQYLREAIMLTVKDIKMIDTVTRTLYPAVAEKYKTSPQKVERAIRNVIDKAWSNGNQDSIDNLLGYSSNNNRGKPTNSELIAMLADKVRYSLNGSN